MDGMSEHTPHTWDRWRRQTWEYRRSDAEEDTVGTYTMEVSSR